MGNASDTEHEHTLTLDRVIEAPIDKVWRCWTESSLLELWFAPKPWHLTNLRLDLNPGGEFSFTLNGPDGEQFENTGVFLEVDPQNRLVTTDAFGPGWVPNGKPFMVAEMTFEDIGNGKTRYIARAMHWSAEACKEHEEMGFHEGWGKTADQLEELARSL